MFLKLVCVTSSQLIEESETCVDFSHDYKLKLRLIFLRAVRWLILSAILLRPASVICMLLSMKLDICICTHLPIESEEEFLKTRQMAYSISDAHQALICDLRTPSKMK